MNKRIDIPDYLMCRISDDLMEEPVMLSSGFTYEKTMIQQHFSTNGNFDPMTREEVDVKYLVLNKHIKSATEDFLRKNPWAFEFIPGEKIEDINM